MVGVTSIGFHTVPLICRTTLDCPGSLHVTVADFVTMPPKLAELNCSGMTPVLPGSTRLSHSPAVVQPHPGRTAVISRVALPVLVKMKSWRTNSPALTLPKWYTLVSNSIFGAEVCAAVTVAVALAVEAALVWAKADARPPRAQAVVHRVTNLIFIGRHSLAEMVSSCTKITKGCRFILALSWLESVALLAHRKRLFYLA